METEHKELFIVLSQSGSLVSRALKLYTRAEYNHVSLALDSDLERMYSFGRKYAFYPFPGGFVTESASFGTFKRFINSKIVILKLKTDIKTYLEISEFLKEMNEERGKYRYNYLGILYAVFKKNRKKEYEYYCSEFVKEVLQKHGVNGCENLPKVIQPIHFLNIPTSEIIYKGSLKNYIS